MTNRLSAPATVLDEGRLPTDGSARLVQARRLVDDGAVSVVSFDLFDTVLWRRVPRPADAFVLLGGELAAAGLLPPTHGPAAFRRLRVEAEKRARRRRDRRGDGEEVGLEEIWDQFPDHVLGGPHQAEGARLELDLERRITVADLDVVAFAEFAAERGCPLLVVSNTYFSAQQLATLLDRPETAVFANARLYASANHGVNKGDGLWKVVLGDLDVPADRVLHVGDELTSDVTVPVEHGVHAVHFRRAADATLAVLARERVLPGGDDIPPVPAVVTDGVGDFGLTGLRAKVGSRVEALDLPDDQVTAWHFGATVLGPVMTGFADWVHDHAEALGVPTVWAMMREGEFLADLVGRAAAARGSARPARPVWLSRHVTARATITEGSEDELALLLNRRLVPTVAEFLANVGLGLGEVPELRSAAGERMDQPALAADVLGTLAGSDHLRTRVLAESAAARARLVASLAPMLHEEGDTSLLVDLGWAGTIQRQLVSVLRLSGIERRLVGCYLMTNHGAGARVLDGVEITGYLSDCGEPWNDVVQIGRSPEVLEQCCLATCGSLVDFDGAGEPVLDGSVPPPEQVTSKVAVQHGVRAFQREWQRYATAVPGWAPLDGRERPALLEILRASVSAPTAAEARTFGAWTHDDNFGVDRREQVIPDRLGAYTPYLSPLDLLEMTMQDAFWPLGLAAEYDPALASATQAVLAGAIPREAFSARRPAEAVEMWVDSGAGWHANQKKPLRINRNGLSYIHFDIRAESVRTVRLDPADHAAIFRIDWIDLALRVRGNPEPVRVRLERTEDFSAFVYAGCRWLYDGVGIAFGDDPQIHIPVAHRAGGEIYGVELTAALAVMSLPPTTQAVGLGGAAYGTAVTAALGKVRREASAGGPAAVGRGALRYVRRRLG